MKLRYIGPRETPPPLPEGWPALDHDEPDAQRAQAKIGFRIKPSGEPAYEQVKAASAAKGDSSNG